MTLVYMLCKPFSILFQLRDPWQPVIATNEVRLTQVNSKYLHTEYTNGYRKHTGPSEIVEAQPLAFRTLPWLQQYNHGNSIAKISMWVCIIERSDILADVAHINKTFVNKF